MISSLILPFRPCSSYIFSLNVSYVIINFQLVHILSKISLFQCFLLCCQTFSWIKYIFIYYIAKKESTRTHIRISKTQHTHTHIKLHTQTHTYIQTYTYSTYVFPWRVCVSTILLTILSNFLIPNLSIFSSPSLSFPALSLPSLAGSPLHHHYNLIMSIWYSWR